MNNKATIAERIAAQIIEMLEHGECPWKKPWALNEWPTSSDGHPYRGINIWLLAFHPYSSNRWATLNKINQLGGCVKKGEHGRQIVLWKQTCYTKQNDDGELERHIYPLMRGYTVFNLEQADGIPEEMLHKGEVAEHSPILEAEAVWEGYKDRPELHHGGDRAYYRPSTDTIRLPEMTRFYSTSEYYCALFHEAAHSTGVEKRLNRPDFGSHAINEYGHEELVAELTSAMLCTYCGIEQETITNSAAYCQSWAKSIREAPANAIIKAASQAQKAYDYILGKKHESKEVE